VKSVDFDTTPVADLLTCRRDLGRGRSERAIEWWDRLFRSYKFSTMHLTERISSGRGSVSAIDLSAGSYSKVYSISNMDPYVTTTDWVARSTFLQATKPAHLVFSSFSSTSVQRGSDFSYPISEWQVARFGLSASTPTTWRPPIPLSRSRTGPPQWQFVPSIGRFQCRLGHGRGHGRLTAG